MSAWARRAAQLAVTAGVALPRREGMSGVVGLTVTGEGREQCRARLVLLDGRVDAVELGPAGAADLTLELERADAAAVLDGTLAPSVAYMRGRLKSSGDNSLLLGLLAASSERAWEDWRVAASGGAGAGTPGEQDG